MTPGETAYTAFWTTDLPDLRGAQWAALPPSTQARWEAAAQAVLTHRPTPIELPRCLYCTAYASDTIHLCEEHYRLKETP